jgi:hypothetical protein
MENDSGRLEESQSEPRCEGKTHGSRVELEDSFALVSGGCLTHLTLDVLSVLQGRKTRGKVVSVRRGNAGIVR